MIKKTIKLVLLFSSLFFIGWGRVGHSVISSNVTKFFHVEMNDFLFWNDYLIAHGSDADSRKSSDPTEGHKHYIDIDNYAVFNSYGRIPSTIDSAITIFGQTFVDDQGILPWTTKNTVDSITAAFSRRDFERALYFSADLSHYVGDGHMPLHITKNYNGQFSDQYGIHSRYESTMIGKYSSQISYSGDSVHYVDDVQNYIFQYIYSNYEYVDSILAADKSATSDAGGSTSSDLYYQKLWEYTNVYTTTLFHNASLAIAELIYTAWIDAGRPELNTSGIDSETRVDNFKLEQNYPNPFNPSTIIKYQIPDNNGQTQNIKLSVSNILGQEIAVLVNKEQKAGTYEVEFTADNLTSGVYIYKLQAGKFSKTNKMSLLK